MNVIARLEFELAYYDSEVHRFNQSHHEDTPFLKVKIKTKIQSKLVYLVEFDVKGLNNPLYKRSQFQEAILQTKNLNLP